MKGVNTPLGGTTLSLAGYHYQKLGKHWIVKAFVMIVIKESTDSKEGLQSTRNWTKERKKNKTMYKMLCRLLCIFNIHLWVTEIEGHEITRNCVDCKRKELFSNEQWVEIKE